MTINKHFAFWVGTLSLYVVLVVNITPAQAQFGYITATPTVTGTPPTATPTATATPTVTGTPPTATPTATAPATPTATPDASNTVGLKAHTPPGEGESMFNFEALPIPTADPELVSQIAINWGVEDLNYIASITVTMIAFVEQQQYIFIGLVLALALWVLGKVSNYVTDAPRPGRTRLNISGAKKMFVDDQVPED